MATVRSQTSTMKASFACHYRLSKAAGCPSVVVWLVPKKLTSLSHRLCQTTSPPSPVRPELPCQNLQGPPNQSPIRRLRPSIQSLSPEHRPRLCLRPPSDRRPPRWLGRKESLIPRPMLLAPPPLLLRLHPIRGVESKTPMIRRTRLIVRALEVRGRRLGAPSTVMLQSQRLNKQKTQPLTYHHGRANVP
jgi:hypothetical protein